MSLEEADTFRPSEYTAALLRAVEHVASSRTVSRAIEIGVGSGVVLNAICNSGIGHSWGVDIEPEALVQTQSLLQKAGHSKIFSPLLSDVWDGVSIKNFDLIVANLPHFPADLPPKADRLPSWSGGGRKLVDRYLLGLPNKLSRSGVALMTHLDLIGLDQTMALIKSLGLTSRSLFTWTVYQSAWHIKAAFAGPETYPPISSLRRYGDYYFVDARVLEIAWPTDRRISELS